MERDGGPIHRLCERAHGSRAARSSADFALALALLNSSAMAGL